MTEKWHATWMCKDKIKKCIVQFGGKFQFIDSVQFAEAQQAFVFDKKNPSFLSLKLFWGGSDMLLTIILQQGSHSVSFH